MDVNGQWKPDDGTPGFMFIGTTALPHKFPRIWTTSFEWARLANKRFRERFGDVMFGSIVIRPSLDRSLRGRGQPVSGDSKAYEATRSETRRLPLVYAEEQPCESCIDLVALGEKLDKQVLAETSALYREVNTQFAHGSQIDRTQKAIDKADDLKRDHRGMLGLAFLLLCLLFVNLVVCLEGM
jgi:hypothetical protein